MVHIKIIEICGGELEHVLRSIFIEPSSTEEYINEPEDIVKRNKIGRTWEKLDIKSPNKPFIKKDKSNTNEKRKCHKCGLIGHLGNNCLKKEKINKIVEAENNNDKEEETESERET
ncbi:hypothetical protein O181_005443 [Austropuccinia psidii MF-1]|uniref:CCHC-type domain-containing protein n=1 Tax=Austropuccinia psidii MF-1 TaxID=1389203 RepID=A0A9Q3GFJ4_9BASI|nr:hypothetical protein [Austropuccinia psidii MF-1]